MVCFRYFFNKFYIESDNKKFMHRIISLIPSATEIICAMGFEENLVGRSHECDYPASVQRLPVCTEPKINTNATSLEIDNRVKAILEKALSVYKVHVDELEKLKPTLIITQSQCEVCAVSLNDVEKAVSEFVDSKPRIVSLEPNTIADILKDILHVSSALNATNRGEDLIRKMQLSMRNIADKSINLPKPTIGCIEWIEPLMAAGNWVPELVGMAGGKNLFGTAGKHSPWIKLEEFIKQDPELIVVMPCGFDIHKTIEEMRALTNKKLWTDLKAVKNHKVYVVDGNQYFNRPGPRIVESLEILAEIFHPNVFDFGQAQKGWQKFIPITYSDQL